MPYRGAGSTYWADATFSENLPDWAANFRYEGTITPKFILTASINTWGYNLVDTSAPGLDCPTEHAEIPCVNGQPAPRLYEVHIHRLRRRLSPHHF